MDIIKYILLAIFVPFILVAILGLVLNVSMAAWKASCKLKPKIIGKLVAIIATTIVAVATLGFAVALAILGFHLTPFSL